MPNKNTPNGFYMFMLEEQQKIKAKTKRAPSMHEMPAMCKDTWKSLSAAEKAHYDTLAKQEKSRQRGGSDKDKYRKDNQRQIIAHRIDPVVEKEKKRRHQTEKMIESWGHKDLLNIVFHVIDFQVMYDERHEDHHLPLELGMVTFTLRDGLQKSFHTFINPGDIPQGNRHLAYKHSDNTHKIPADFERGDKNYRGIWKQINNFLEADGEDVEYIPPLFCLSDNTEIVESCLDFLHTMSDSVEPNLIHKIYCMEDLVSSLIMQSGKANRRPVLSQVHDALKQNIWDYTSSIRCSYHEETDCSYCSLSIVRRHSFAAFDLLTNVLQFPLTKHHVPEDSGQQFQVLAPEAFGRAFQRGKQRREFDRPSQSKWREEGRSPSPFRTPQPHYEQQQQQERAASFAAATTAQPARGWTLPSVGKIEIGLSDDEDDDEDELNSAQHSSEVRSTSDQYVLKELRKPKTPSMLQGGPSMPSTAARLGRGAPLRAPAASAWGVPPPPGFTTRPTFPVPSPQVRPVQSLGRGVRPMSTAPAVGRGRGRGLGRGLPPQI